MTEDIDGCEIEKDKGNTLAQYQGFQKEIVANPIVREGDQLDENTQIVQLKPAQSKAIKHKLPPRELAVIRLPSLKKWRMIKYFMHMQTVFCTLKPTRVMHVLWFNVMVSVMSGSIHLNSSNHRGNGLCI